MWAIIKQTFDIVWVVAYNLLLLDHRQKQKSKLKTCQLADTGNSLSSDDDDELMLNVLRCQLTYTRTWSDDDGDDCFYIVLFSALEQTHCTRMWFYMSD